MCDFSNNKLRSCAEGFVHPQLVKLNLSRNKMENLDGLTAENLPSLRHLELQQNGLASIGSLAIPTLNVLHLEGNKLQDLAGIGALTALQELYVRGNEIKTLDGLSADQVQRAACAERHEHLASRSRQRPCELVERGDAGPTSDQQGGATGLFDRKALPERAEHRE